MANNGESFLLYRTQCKSLLKLPDDKRGKLLAYIIGYAFDGIVPEIDDLACEVLFDQISDQIDRDRDKYQKKCERNKQIALEREKKKKEKTDVNERERTYTNGTYTDTDTYTDTYTDTDNDTDTDKKPKPTRHKYGSYKNVLLSDEDLEKLRSEFPADWKQRIERLSEYQASSGKTYKDYLATIRAWARKDGDQEQTVKPKSKNRFNNFEQREYNYEELEKQLLQSQGMYGG